MKTQYKLKRTALAVSLSLLVGGNLAIAQEDEAIEEVVVKASRLQGSAAAVVEERRNQAFVADILGAEQIAKTGDSDAASALRRVTGLTLIDGKFIFVRGLGERYSSARLNGANIPSPDLTRNVIPLDIFPSSIIESLSVQKSFSPSMPAAFGGGAIDIRTKNAPSEFTANVEISGGYNTNSSNGNTYSEDTSGLASDIENAITAFQGDFTLRNLLQTDTSLDNAAATELNQNLLRTLPRNTGFKSESLNPNFGIKGSIGNSFDESFFGGEIGFLASVAYDNSSKFSERFTSVLSQNFTDNCDTESFTSEQIANTCFDRSTDIETTTVSERLTALLNVSYKLKNHEVKVLNIYLEDVEDETEINIAQTFGSSESTIFGNGEATRTHEIEYEERTLEVTQLIGKHTFLDFYGLGFDWQYTESEANTEIPTSVNYVFNDFYDSDGNYLSSEITGDDNRVIFEFVDLQDNVNSSSGNFTLPFYLSNVEIELTAGYDFSDRGRVYTTSSFAINNESNQAIELSTSESEILDLTGFLSDEFIDNNNVLVNFNEPSAPDADDYLAAQKIDAGYAAFDVIYKGQFRLSGGLRYESFKQVTIATSSLIFDAGDLNDLFDPDIIQDGTINESDTYGALAFTYIGGENYQIRLSYGETVVRPDLRELVPVAYIDPLTDLRTIGRAGLETSDIKNYDARFEYYAGNGNNYSVGVFYKNINAPIESTLTIGDGEFTQSFVNGDVATLIGVEFEWLQDLTFINDGLFTSGNITLSDSESTIDPGTGGTLTNFERRLSGHSEYVVNLQLNYDSANGKHSSSLVYNVFGERIVASGVSGIEDAFEQPFHSLDAVYTYYPDFNSKIKFKVKNLLAEEQEVTQSDIVVRTREVGTIFSVSYQYDF